MIRIKSIRREIQPTKKQIQQLYQHAGTARFAYNWGIDRMKCHYAETKETLTAIDLHKMWVQEKNRPESPIAWAKQVSKCSPQYALGNLETAFKRFFKKTSGYPNRKKRSSRDSYTVDGCVSLLSPKRIHIPILKSVKLKEPVNYQGKIKAVTVSRDVDRWFISFKIEEEFNFNNTSNDVIGIDLGLKVFATCSDHNSFAAPYPLKRNLDLLRRRSRQHSKKLKGSNNRRKSQIRLAKLHRKIRRIRLDFLHKLTTHLTRTKSVIVVESLNVPGMIQNPNLSRSISDVGWGSFLSMLSYKAQWYDCLLIEASQWYPSTQLCSSCGKRPEKSVTLDIRTYHCNHCGLVIDRDLNASYNLRNLGLMILNYFVVLCSTTVSSTGSNASGDETVVSLMNEELDIMLVNSNVRRTD